MSLGAPPLVQGTVWASTVDPADQIALAPGVPADLDRHPDVVVVGGGVIGLATAVFCRRAGVGRVLVIEAARLAAAASGGAAGALAPELHQLSDPPAFMALARASLALYRQLDHDWDRALGLQRTPGLLLLPEGPPAGGPWPGVELLNSDQVAELVPELVPMPAGLLAHDQARVHPSRLAAALARRAGAVATGVAMTDLEVSGGRIARVRTTVGELHPGVVVFATGLAPEPLGPGASAAGQGPPDRHRAGRVPPGVWCAWSWPWGGVRDRWRAARRRHPRRGDFSAQVRPEVIQGIRRRLGALLPAAGQARVRYQWCCFRPATGDGQPVIDRVPGLDNAWVSAGHDGTGLLMAPATGQALATWITTSRHPKRSPASASPDSPGGNPDRGGHPALLGRQGFESPASCQNCSSQAILASSGNDGRSGGHSSVA